MGRARGRASTRSPTRSSKGVPHEWLALADRDALTEEQKRRVEALGGWDALMETLRRRLEEQDEAHHGGSKWIGTGGTSPFGHGGFTTPRACASAASRGSGARRRSGRSASTATSTARRELGTRTFRMALRKLRRLARDGRADTLDLDGTIRETARNARAPRHPPRSERRNAMKVLLLLDVGGSMDPHAALSETLFSAARSEFRSLDVLYFHNFPYETLWRENARRRTGARADPRS